MEEITTTKETAVPIGQQVDPAVSKVKFDQELNQFRQAEAFHRSRGIFLLRSEFPVIHLAFGAFRIQPLVLAFAVKLDFTNYDLEPPSLKFIDPITEVQLRRQELNINFNRRINNDQVPQADINGLAIIHQQDLIQSHEPEHIPFLCLPGIREYHLHPAHSNDPWLDHRGTGEGTLGFIIDQLVKYGTEPISGVLPRAVNIAMLVQGTMQVQYNGILFTNDKIPS